MKKFIALLTSLIMICSMGTVAFAENASDPYDGKLDIEPVVPKTYVVENGTAPAETFTYSFEGISYKNGDGNIVSDAVIPAIEDVTISFDAISETTTKTVAVDIDADDYELGVYTYEVTENVDTETTGVTYSTEKLYLVLSIVRDENSGKHFVGAMHYEDIEETEKSTGFSNKYDAGSLNVTKEITGNMADMNKKFSFTVTFTAPVGTVALSEIGYSVAGAAKTPLTFNNGVATATFELGDGATASFTNIPEGVTYTVVEDHENYTLVSEVYSDTEKTISGTTYAEDGTATLEVDTAEFTNDLTSRVDTGINLNNMSYVIILAVAAFGVIVFIRKRFTTI